MKMSEEYTGIIQNYRIGLNNQKTDQCLIKVKDVESALVRTFIGYKVSWPYVNPKIVGKITRLHGRSGSLRAKFSRGIPGQAIGSLVRVYK